MRCTWIYTGDDGKSHFADLDIPLKAAGHSSLSESVPASEVLLRETPPTGFVDFHPAPRRQFVVTLSGLAEIECGDGATRRFGAGDIMLADDTWGQGHITREIEGPRRSLFIILGDGVDPAAWRV